MVLINSFTAGKLAIKTRTAVSTRLSTDSQARRINSTMTVLLSHVSEHKCSSEALQHQYCIHSDHQISGVVNAKHLSHQVDLHLKWLQSSTDGLSEQRRSRKRAGAKSLHYKVSSTHPGSLFLIWLPLPYHQPSSDCIITTTRQPRLPPLRALTKQN